MRGKGPRKNVKTKGGRAGRKGEKERGRRNKSIWTTMRLKWTFWDILGQFGSLFDKFGASRLFSQSFTTIFSHNRLIEKNA